MGASNPSSACCHWYHGMLYTPSIYILVFSWNSSKGSGYGRKAHGFPYLDSPLLYPLFSTLWICLLITVHPSDWQVLHSRPFSLIFHTIFAKLYLTFSTCVQTTKIIMLHILNQPTVNTNCLCSYNANSRHFHHSTSLIHPPFKITHIHPSHAQQLYLVPCLQCIWWGWQNTLYCIRIPFTSIQMFLFHYVLSGLSFQIEITLQLSTRHVRYNDNFLNPCTYQYYH